MAQTQSPKMTKKEFEEMLNALPGSSNNEGWNAKSGPRSRPYGTWLRSADREKFNFDYEEYLKANG